MLAQCALMIQRESFGDRLHEGFSVEVYKTVSTNMGLVQVPAKFTRVVLLSANDASMAQDLLHILCSPKVTEGPVQKDVRKTSLNGFWD